MLETSKKVTVTGDSKIDGVVVERYSAAIDETKPENLTFTRVIIDGQLRKDNRKQCRKDQAAFEDEAYAMQDELIETDSKTLETETETTETE